MGAIRKKISLISDSPARQVRFTIIRLIDFDSSFNDETLTAIKSGDSKEWFINLCNKTFGDLEHLKTIPNW